MTFENAAWNASGVVDIAMQRPRHVAPVEHALFAGQDRKHLFGLFADQLGVAPRALRIKPPLRNLLAAPLHLRGVNAHMQRRLDLKPALGVRAAVNFLVQFGAGKMHIGDLLPGLPDFDKLNLRQRQALPRKPFVLALQIRLVAKPVRRQSPRRHHQMRVKIPLVRLAMRRMDGEIHRRPVLVRQPLRKFARQSQPLPGGQFMRQGDLEFPRHPRVFPLLRSLGRIPQGRTIQSPFRL